MYFGIDIHDTFYHLAVVDDRGKLLRQEQIGTTLQALQAFHDQVKRDKPRGIAMEACTGAYRLRDHLVAAGSPVVVVDPKAFRKRFPKAGKKTDFHDAFNLAEYARFGGDGIWIPTSELRQQRMLANIHVSLTCQATRIKNEVHAALKEFAVSEQPRPKNLWSKKGQYWLQGVLATVPQTVRFCIDLQLESLQKINEQLGRVSQQIARICLHDNIVAILMTHPGVGMVASFLMNTEVGDWHRFPKPGNLVSYSGLISSVNQSGTAKAKAGGRITKSGRARLRWSAVECAIVARRHCPTIDAMHRRIKHRTKINGKAKVAIGRKLLERLWHMVNRGTPCHDGPQKLYEGKRKLLERTASDTPRKSRQKRTTS